MYNSYLLIIIYYLPTGKRNSFYSVTFSISLSEVVSMSESVVELEVDLSAVSVVASELGEGVRGMFSTMRL